MAVIRLERPLGSTEVPRALVAVRDAFFGALEVRYLPGRLCLTVFLAFLAAEGVLLGRLWVQLSGSSTTGGFFGHLYAWSSPLVAPFRGYEGGVPIRDTGIFEFATLAAMEVYLVATLIVVVTLLVVPRVLTFVLTLVLGRFNLGVKPPRVVFAMDAIKMIETGSLAPLPASHNRDKPNRHGAAVHNRTRPTRGRQKRSRLF